MPEYKSPGVYVEEVPSSIKPIAGVSTSTAGFIGIVPDKLPKPSPGTPAPKPAPTPPAPKTKTIQTEASKRYYDLDDGPVDITAGSYKISVVPETTATATLDNEATGGKGRVNFASAPGPSKTITVEYRLTPAPDTAPDRTAAPVEEINVPTAAGVAKLCTNFTEYTNAFGDFSLVPGHQALTHAVYGFFNNGGTRCYVVRIAALGDLKKALDAFELVDEISIVAAPGLLSLDARNAIVGHCDKLGDRFAILDGPETADTTKLTQLQTTATDGGLMPAAAKNAAWYFPWIKVFDPAAKKAENPKDGIIAVPPSGHIAGVYARVDAERGVHKAPANEPIRGALDVTQRLSKDHQNGLNPDGVNCIRVLNDNILVWGARTIGGAKNTDSMYINVRRTLLFLRESIDEGTQWAVFEPNNQALWQKITRNVTAFLTNVWRAGALFGDSPQEAFYVRCNRETNPQSQIEAGQVVTEIGVALVRPAEFVIFRISQVAGAGA